MNRIYSDLHGALESYGVTGHDDPHELAGIVVRETLDKLFVQEVIHPAGRLDVDVSHAAGVEEALAVPDAFSISSYSVTDHPDRYQVELVADHLERDYTYSFEGSVPQSGGSDVEVERAAIEPSTAVTGRQYA